MSPYESALEAAAAFIEENELVHTSEGEEPRPRRDGNRSGLGYAAGIRSLPHSFMTPSPNPAREEASDLEFALHVIGVATEDRDEADTVEMGVGDLRLIAQLLSAPPAGGGVDAPIVEAGGGVPDGRTISGEICMGMPVAAYIADSRHGAEFGYQYASHWSTIPDHAKPERLFRESDVRAALARTPPAPSVTPSGASVEAVAVKPTVEQIARAICRGRDLNPDCQNQGAARDGSVDGNWPEPRENFGRPYDTRWHYGWRNQAKAAQAVLDLLASLTPAPTQGDGGSEVCPGCSGSGEDDWGSACRLCAGGGRVMVAEDACPACKGKGCEADYIGDDMKCVAVACSACNGTGRALAPPPAPLPPSGASVEAVDVDALAKRMWSVTPREVQDSGLTRSQWYAREIRAAFAAGQSTHAEGQWRLWEARALAAENEVVRLRALTSAPSPAGGVREAFAKIAEGQVADAVGDDDAAKAYRMACYDCAEAIRAALSSPATPEPALAGGVRVKALEWEYSTGHLPHQEVWSSGDPWMFWIVKNGDGPYVWCENLGFADMVPASPVRGEFKTLDEAKAAAQADYEDRILSSLSPASGGADHG